MGFFDLKAQCGVCGKEVGMNRYKIRKSDAWCCPECFKKASSYGVVNVATMTIEDLKNMISPKEVSADQFDMNTAEGMDAYAKAGGYIYIGDSALKHFEVIEKHLLPGEKVLMALAPNSIYNGPNIVMGGVTAMAFTNKRLVYGQQSKILGTPVKSVNLDNVNDVQKDAFGLVEGSISIDTLKENITFKFQKQCVDRIYGDVMKILDTYRAEKNNAPIISVAATSNADELKKFKELLDAGIINQEEFDAKKKQLLGL